MKKFKVIFSECHKGNKINSLKNKMMLASSEIHKESMAREDLQHGGPFHKKCPDICPVVRVEKSNP